MKKNLNDETIEKRLELNKILSSSNNFADIVSGLLMDMRLQNELIMSELRELNSSILLLNTRIDRIIDRLWG